MKRGWCPTLDAPMDAADGTLVRVRPPLGRLPAAAARQLAAAAERWASGRMELTSHGNIQVRGVRDVGAFATECGLPSPAGRIVVSPLAGDDPACHPDTLAHAAALEVRVAQDGVPRPKWTAVVDGGGALGLGHLAADERTVLAPGPNTEWLAGPVLHGGGTAWAWALPFGELSASLLRDLAALAEAQGGGVLRLSPWRALLLGRVQHTPATPPGTITNPADPLLRTAACIGNDGCAQGTVAARAIARRFARPGLHVSGCAKGCAHPGPARLTLVGRDGRFDVVRGGTAHDKPAREAVDLRP